MINTRKFGGVLTSSLFRERGNGSVRLVPSERLPKGGQRWNNASEIGGVINV